MEFLSIAGRIIESPVTALVAGLILGAVSISGRLSFIGAHLILVLAVVVSIIGILRSSADWRLSLASVFGIMAIACLLLYYVRPKASEPILAVTPTTTLGNGDETSVQLSITCDIVSLPMTYRGDLWILDTVMFNGLAKMMYPSDKEVLWPEEGVNGFGYACTVTNYGTKPAYGVMLQASISVMSIIREGNTWKEGDIKKTHELTLSIPKPLGQQGSDQFSFYVCSYNPDESLRFHLPSSAFINSGDLKNKREVALEVAPLGGNPFSVLPKNPFHHIPKPTAAPPSRKSHRS